MKPARVRTLPAVSPKEQVQYLRRRIETHQRKMDHELERLEGKDKWGGFTKAYEPPVIKAARKLVEDFDKQHCAAFDARDSQIERLPAYLYEQLIFHPAKDVLPLVRVYESLALPRVLEITALMEDRNDPPVGFPLINPASS